MTQPTPIVLKAADVIAAARKAYDEGRLSAQGPTPACKYRDDSGRPCAIGAALDDETAKRFDEQDPWSATGVRALQSRGFLSADDVKALVQLQVAHDEWCDRADIPTSSPFFENNFRKLIGHGPKSAVQA